MTRVLVADDHPLFRRGLSASLGDIAGVQVVGEVANGQQALAAARELNPDVILMDLAMPVMDGRTACQVIHTEMPHIAVLVLTMSDDPDSISAALTAGARGYLLKGADEDTIARALATVSTGDMHLSHAAAQHLLGTLTGRNPTPQPFPHLSPRETEILDHVAQGQGNAVIARELFLSDKTVRNHVSTILSKIGAADRSEAIQQARRAGLGRPT